MLLRRLAAFSLVLGLLLLLHPLRLLLWAERCDARIVDQAVHYRMVKGARVADVIYTIEVPLTDTETLHLQVTNGPARDGKLPILFFPEEARRGMVTVNSAGSLWSVPLVLSVVGFLGLIFRRPHPPQKV